MENEDENDKFEKIHSKLNLLISIKSQYILRSIFSHLNEKRKLLLMNNNKLIQNKLNLDLEYFKKISGKYKIAEKNGLGKEYILDSDILVFEGENKNRRRNGKGKEYDKGNLTFEGEYKNGQKNGKGKEYTNYVYGLFFEGEYLNGKKIGKGKEYNYYNI